MGYECIQSCQIEVSPGVFRFVVAGNTHFTKDQVIDYVKPISRKYFKLTGDAVKEDVIDKARIKRALDKRKIKYPASASTSDVAKLLAVDNNRRGITDLESIEIVKPSNHFADKKVIDAKARIDELFGPYKNKKRPYKEDAPLDDLLKIISDKEAKILEDEVGNE